MKREFEEELIYCEQKSRPWHLDPGRKSITKRSGPTIRSFQAEEDFPWSLVELSGGDE